MLLELTRSGGFTGTTVRWRVDTGEDPTWETLLDRAQLRFQGPLAQVARVLLPRLVGPGSHDHSYVLSCAGKRARFRGIDVTGEVAALVDRITHEGQVIQSR